MSALRSAVIRRWRTIGGIEAARAPADALSEDVLIRTAIDHVGRGVQMIDAAGRIVFANAQAAEMLGVSKELLASRPLVSEVVAEQMRLQEFRANSEALQQQITTHLPDTQPFRFRRLRPNSQIIEVENIQLAGGGMVRTHTDVTDRHKAEQRIAFLAHHDFLTGLANRSRFQQAIESAIESNHGYALVFIDVDRFKIVNDTLGHEFGDALLREVAARVCAQVREGDVVARLGGDELAVLVAPLQDSLISEAIGAQIVEAMRPPFERANQIQHPSVSVGLAFVAPGCAEPGMAEATQWQADMALYAAKAAGRGCWRAFDPSMATRESEQRSTLIALRNAIDEEQFEVVYQPVFNLGDHAVCGVEALVRWHHPERGFLEAGQFIPLAESSGFIVPIGLWVLRRACNDALQWPGAVRLLVNLSPRQVASAGLVRSVAEVLAETGFPPHRLELEITESSIFGSGESAEQVLVSLRGLGVRIALDDFGTGYSSLSHICMLRFDTIKIDRSFVSQVLSRADCGAIVRAVASLARDLDIRTVAEGVETAEQLAWIRDVGCDEVQGYLLSKPILKSEADRLLLGEDAALCDPSFADVSAR